MSLRDVERAMMVFEYMYSMMNVFGPLTDKWAEKEIADMKKQNGANIKVKGHGSYSCALDFQYNFTSIPFANEFANASSCFLDA